MSSLSVLPQEFLSRMELMLQEEYPAFLESYENPRTYGLRVNTARLSCEEFLSVVPFPVAPIPWIKNGYFYPSDVRPSQCPLYQAGVYYLQEPSAMTPASRLPVEPGDRIIDLCAAPGGKATALGSALQGKGLLVANDISASRAKALLRNIELFGISNAVVTSEPPARLAERFPSYFNKVLLDAPCSGEGMFRKEEALALDWSPQKSEELSMIQKQLIENAAELLMPGGLLLYSTCTFSEAEDEDVIEHLLSIRDDMELIPMEGYAGFSSGRKGLKCCVRIFPHKMEGEGHFLALLRKRGTTVSPETLHASIPTQISSSRGKKKDRKAADPLADVLHFFQEIGLQTLAGKAIEPHRLEIRGDKVYYQPPVLPDIRGLNFLRAGVHVGDLKKNRFEPSVPFALMLSASDLSSVISLPPEDPRLASYLRGESIPVSSEEAPSEKGWHLLCAAGYPLSFGKIVNGILKNKYPSGWRLH